MDDDLDPVTARAALDGATSSAARLRARARWASTKLAVFGVGLGLVTLVVGLVESTALGLAAFAGWGVVVLLMIRWERRRTAHLPGTAARIAPYWAGSFIAYAVAIAVGTGEATTDPAFWVPAAVLVALPMLIGAVRERRA